MEKKKEQDKAKEKQQEELSKQRQIEKVTHTYKHTYKSKYYFFMYFFFFISSFQDLEEQSRLIAASSRPANPSASDGHVLVLSHSHSEDSDAGDEVKKRGESDA